MSREREQVERPRRSLPTLLLFVLFAGERARNTSRPFPMPSPAVDMFGQFPTAAAAATAAEKVKHRPSS